MQNSRSLKEAFDSSFNVHFSVFAHGQFLEKELRVTFYNFIIL